MKIAIDRLTPSQSLVEIDATVKNRIVGGGFQLSSFFDLDNFEVVLDGGASSSNFVLDNSASGVSRVVFLGNNGGGVTASVTTNVTNGSSTVSSVSFSGNM